MVNLSKQPIPCQLCVDGVQFGPTDCQLCVAYWKLFKPGSLVVKIESGVYG